MRLLLPAIFSLIHICLWGQELDSVSVVVADTTALEIPEEEVSESKSWKFMTGRFQWDYGKNLIAIGGRENKLEGGAELLFLERFQLVAEYGNWSSNPANSFNNVDYTVEGTFYRFGAGYLGWVVPKNRIGLGFRYGKAEFEDRGTISIPSTGFVDDFTTVFDRKNLSASWVELVLDSEKELNLMKSNPESKLNNLVSLGFYFRYKILLSSSSFDDVDVFSIPGYGRSINKRLPSINLFVKFKIF